MFLNGFRLRYVDADGKEVVVPAKGRTFEIGSYFSCDLLLAPQEERLLCEIKCDAFGRVNIYNKSTKETTIHLNDKIIHGQRYHPLLHGNRITILDRVYTWESYKMSGTEDVPSTPERLSPVEQAPNSCPSTKSHRPEIDKRLTVHNFRYSINSNDEGNTSIESRDQNESHLDEEESLNLSAPPSTELSSCETPKVDLVEATQNKENTATPSAIHRHLLQLCALSDVVITSFSPRETGVKVEKSFTCIRKPTKFGKQSASAASVSMSTPKSVYSTPKGGGVLSELNDDSCSRDLVDFSTPSTSKKTNRQSSMYLIDLTTPSRLRPSSVKQMPTPISVNSTDASPDGSPFVIDITESPTPSRSQLTKTPRRPATAAATPTRTPQSLMKRALLTSTKKKHIAKQTDKTPVSTPNRPSLLEKRRLCRTTPRLPFRSFPTPEQIEAQRAEDRKRRQARNTSPRKRLSLHPETPRDTKLSQLRKSLAAAKRSPTVDLGNRLTAKARRTLNSPKSGSPKAERSLSKLASPAMRKTINVSQPKCSSPKTLDDSKDDELSRTFTIMNESGEQAEEASALGIISALVTGKMDGSATAKTLETSLPIKEMVKDNQDDDKLDADGSKSLEESCTEPDHPDEYSSTQTNDIIDDNICEEIHANIPKPPDDDGIGFCEEELPDIKSSEEENKELSSGVETPKIRRSLRRLSVDQKAVVADTTPRRTRRYSVEGCSSNANPKAEGSRRASCSALENIQEVSGTTRRKRRFSEQMCTPTRQSKRLMTAKQILPMDNSIDDMGVIVEEDDDAKSAVVEDEIYGKEVPCDEPDNVDYHGLRDLFRPPKSCSTPHFKGLREMMRTPKVPASPIFGNIEELLDNSSSSSSSITVGRVAAENSKALDSILKTPSARNIMVPNEPASAVLKSRGNSLAPTTEYDLDMTNATLHLDQIFDDVPSTSVAHMEDTETEINVTAISTASGLDPLKESVSSEAPMNDVKSVASHRKDPLTSTTYKTAMQGDLEISTTFGEECDASSRPSSLGSNEMSGIQLLDQTSDSMFSEPLIVSGVDSCDITVEETAAMGLTTTNQPLEISEVDTDSNIGLTEPLVLSDDEAEVITPKKSAAPNKISIADKLEESIALKDFTPNQSQGKQSIAGETKARKTDSLIEEVSLIEVDESVADDSINVTTDEKSLVVELDSSSDTDESPAKEDNVSAAFELTIVESETFPLDATEESIALVEEPVESESAISGVATEIQSDYSDPQIKEPLPAEEEVLEKSRRTTDVGLTEDASAAVDSDSPADNSVNAEEEPSLDSKPIDSESSISKEDSTEKTPEEDQSVIDALPSEEAATDAKSSAAGTDDASVESLGQDVGPNPIESISLIAKPAEVSLVEDNESEKKGDNENDESLGRDESISTVTKPDAGEVSVSNDPKAVDEAPTSEVSLVEAEEAKADDLKNDETPKAEPEQSILKVPTVNAKEMEEGDVEELLPEKPTPNIHDIDVAPPSEESALAATARSSPSPPIIKEDKSSAVFIDSAAESSIVMIQESNITEHTAESGILQEKNTCDEQQTNGEEAKAEVTTINQLYESAAATAAEKSPLQGMDLPEELDPADLTASNQQEDLAVTEVNEDEKDVIPGESTSLETTEIECCGQEPVSPKVVPPADNIPDKENSQNTSSITEEQMPASQDENKGYSPKNAPDQIESKVEVIQLDESSIVEEIGEDSIIAETPRSDQSFVNDLEVVAGNEEIAAQQVPAKQTEEYSILSEESNKAKVICIDSSSEDSLEGNSGQIIPPVTAEAEKNSESAQDGDVSEQLGEATTEDILPESSAVLEASSPAAVHKGDPEIFPTEAPNGSKAIDDEISHIDAALEASATQEPLLAKITEDATANLSADESLRDSESAKIKPQNDELSSTAAETADEFGDPAPTEMQQSVEALQMNSLASPETKLVVLDALISDINNISKPHTKTDRLSIEDEAKDTEKNQDVSEDEVMSDALIEEAAAHASEPNTNVGQQLQLQPDDLHTVAKPPNQNAMQTTTGQEVSDVIELSDDSNSESSSVEGTSVGEDGNTVTGSVSEASVPIQETPPSEDPKDKKVDDVPEEVTGSASEASVPIQETPPSEDRKERKVDDVPEEVTTSASESSAPIQETPPSEDRKERKVDDVPEEDRNAVTGSASEASVLIKATPPSEGFKDRKVNDVPEEVTGPVSEASVPIISTPPSEDPKERKVDDVPKEDCNTVTVIVSEISDASMERLTTEDPKARKVDDAPEDLSCELHVVTESAADVEENKEKAAPAQESVESSGNSTATVHSEKLVSCESGMSEKLNEPSLEVSVSIEASHTASKPLSHNEDASDKEQLKPVKRVTRKGSASVETPAENIMEKSSRRARKPSADVEDVHEKPKRRAVRKASEEVAEPKTDIQKIVETKEDEVLKVIPEEAPSTRPNEDCEQQKEADIHQKQDKDAIEKPRRRARKPSEEVKSADHTEKPKRRGRKPSAEVVETIQKKKESDDAANKEEQPHTSKINKQNELQEEGDSAQKQEKGEELQKSEEAKQEETLKSHANLPKRRVRKESAEETETKAGKKPKLDDILDVIEEKETPSSNQVEEQHEKPKSRGRKASAEKEANILVKLPTADEVLQSIVEEANEPKAIEESEGQKEGRSRRRARKPSKEEELENTTADQPNGIPAHGLTSSDNPLASVPEDQPTVPKKTRKSSEFVPAELHESTKETDHIERPKRRARKPTGDSEQGTQDVPNKPRRRGRTPADPEKQPSAEPVENEPVKKSKRTARKPSVEIVDAVVHNAEAEHPKNIEEAAKPDPEAEAATSKQEEKVETKTRRGGRNLKPETKNIAEEGHSRRRGRKANEEEALKSEDPVEAKTSLEEANTSLEEEAPKELPADSNNEVQELPVAVLAVTAPEKKTTRRVRKASANVDERTPAATKTATRRGIKEDTEDNDDVQEKQIDLQKVPTKSVPAVVVTSGEAEAYLTPRRREGRNMPRKNYDETSDEDKLSSARRARKPAASKALAVKPPEEDATPKVKRQPVEELKTPVADTPPMPEAPTSQRREGRNVPRKNYTEAPDDEKASSSRIRRVRNLTAKGLELIVDTTPRPNTPKPRKGKAGGKEDAAAKRLSLEAVPPPTEAETGADEEPAPVKGRGARRKADNDGSAPPSKRGARGQPEESEQPEVKSAKKNVRATGRKAKAETETDEPAPTKKARGGRAKTPVPPPEEKSAPDPEEHPTPLTKKGRGKTRAKTPAKLNPGDTATEPEDEPAKKPAARSRARGAKSAAVPEPVSEQPGQDLEAEPASSSVTPSRGGSAKKVHFEPTQTADIAAADAENAPKRATRSRRK